MVCLRKGCFNQNTLIYCDTEVPSDQQILSNWVAINFPWLVETAEALEPPDVWPTGVTGYGGLNYLQDKDPLMKSNSLKLVDLPICPLTNGNSKDPHLSFKQKCVLGLNVHPCTALFCWATETQKDKQRASWTIQIWTLLFYLSASQFHAEKPDEFSELWRCASRRTNSPVCSQSPSPLERSISIMNPARNGTWEQTCLWERPDLRAGRVGDPEIASRNGASPRMRKQSRSSHLEKVTVNQS